jgi:hypothetical protein
MKGDIMDPNPVLTNDEIDVARLCLAVWEYHVESIERTDPQIQSASDALRALRVMAPKERTIHLHAATENDTRLMVSVEDLSCILWTVNHVMRHYFHEDPPEYLRRLRQLFFELVCAQKGYYETM